MLSDTLELQSLQATVDEAVLDPARWVDVCDRLADFLGGVGTTIFANADEYLVPELVVRSPSLEGLVTTIFRDGWVERIYRRHALPIIKERGFATDHDIADSRTLRTDPYYADLLASHGLGDFVGLNLVTTTHMYIASVERAASAPPPDERLFERIGLARPILSAGARASIAVGSLRLESWKELATDGSRATFVLNHRGHVIDRSAATDELLDGVIELSQRELHLSDPREDQQLTLLIEAACALGGQAPLPRPVFTAAAGRGSLMFEAVRLPEPLRYFHSLAAALLIVRPVDDRRGDLGNLLREQSGLTTAELKVALALFEGKSLAEYARIAGLSIGTVRQQIKSVYRKTGTGRQNELSALIRRLLESVSG